MVPPAVSGTARVGETLTASGGSWTGNPAPALTRQWRRGASPLPGATGTSYVLTETDYGASITVEVTATNPEGSASALSNAVGPVAGSAPAISGIPTLSGNATVAEALMAAAAGVTGFPAPTRAWQWYRAPATAIPGAMSATYTIQPADEGLALFVRQTETNAEGSDTADSAATDTIQPAAGSGAPDPTDGLTQTFSWTPGSATGRNDVSRNQPIVFAADFTGLDGSSGGMIYEQGGSGVGGYAGFRANGDFVVRAGDGGAPWNANTAYVRVPAAQAPSGDGRLVWEFVPGAPITIRVWWNGTPLGTPVDGNSSSDFAGTGSGGYLGPGANVAGETSNVVAYGTASDLRAYENQTVA